MLNEKEPFNVLKLYLPEYIYQISTMVKLDFINPCTTPSPLIFITLYASLKPLCLRALMSKNKPAHTNQGPNIQ